MPPPIPHSPLAQVGAKGEVRQSASQPPRPLHGRGDTCARLQRSMPPDTIRARSLLSFCRRRDACADLQHSTRPPPHLSAPVRRAAAAGEPAARTADCRSGGSTGGAAVGTARRSEMDILFSNPKEEEEAEAAELSRIVKPWARPTVTVHVSGRVGGDGPREASLSRRGGRGGWASVRAGFEGGGGLVFGSGLAFLAADDSAR
uniref:Uncharacterized protein n=1 Tax=Oryza rufipogon TaxID=4529 RepID=A0A0E0PRC1_ORYRU